MAKTNPRSVKKKSAPQSFQAGGSIGLIIAAIIMIAGIAGIYKWMVIPALENDRAKDPSGLAGNGKGGDSTSGDQQQKLIKSTGANLDSTTINASGNPINNDAWGQVTTQYPEFYASNDVPKYQIDLTKKWYEIASKAWGNYGPTEFWIVGSDESEAIKLNEKYCRLRRQKDYNVNFDACINRDYNFIDYARNGGAGLNLRRNEWENWHGYIITMASKNPNPRENDYKVVVLHEYFHVYQHAHIFSKDDFERDSRNKKNPWWAEGGAEYMAQLLYSKQKGVNSSYLKSAMKSKLNSLSQLGSNVNIKNIPYDDEKTHIAYDIGAWFIAFLIHKTNEETYRVKFFKNLNEMGFEKSFMNSFGSSSDKLLEEFHYKFLKLSTEDMLKIIP